MLLNQARHLASLPTSLLGDIDQTFTQTQNFLKQVDRIAYDVQAIEQAFASYQHFNASQSDQQLINALAQDAGRLRVDAFQHSISVGATTVNNLSATQMQTGTLLGASQSAVGNCRLRRPATSLLAVQARQLVDLTALIAAQGRAQRWSWPGRPPPRTRRASRRSRFLTNGQSYQPQTVADVPLRPRHASRCVRTASPLLIALRRNRLHHSASSWSSPRRAPPTTATRSMPASSLRRARRSKAVRRRRLPERLGGSAPPHPAATQGK